MLCMALAAAGAQAADDVESQVLSRVREFGDAWAVGDVAGADAMLHPDYSHTDIAGVALDRAGWVASTKGRKVAKYVNELDGMVVRVYGDVAIVTGKNAFWPVGRDPKAFRQELRFTQIWLKTKGEWLRLVFQGTPVR